MLRAALFLSVSILLSSCAISVKETPGLKLYKAGQLEAARQTLEEEVRKGQMDGAYALGLMYLNGQGAPADPVRAETLFHDAAVAGDPNAVSQLRKFLKTSSRCEKDEQLNALWGEVGLMNRNLVTGLIELNTARPKALMDMAQIYVSPCEGMRPRPDLARNLVYLAQLPRTMYIYVPN